MSYRVLAPVGILFTIGTIAALVRAQEMPTSANGSNGISARASDSNSRELRSVLVGPTGSGLNRTVREPKPQTEAPSELPAAPARLADSPRQNRQEPAGRPATGQSSNWGGATITGPVLNNPAASAPIRSPVSPPSEPTANGLQGELEPINISDGETQPAVPSRPAFVPPTVTPQTVDDRLSARRTSINPRATRRPLKEGILLSSQGPSLRVETRGSDAVLIGRASEYVVALINEGGTAAEGVHVRVALPSFVQVTMATSKAGPIRPQDGEAKQQTLDWVIDEVAPGAETLLKLTLTPTENRPFDLSVDWTLKPPSATAQIVVQKPELELAMFGPKDMLYGKTAVFTIQITNPGSGPAEDVSLSFAYGQRQLPTKPIGTIAAGEQTEVDVELTAAEAGMLRIAATALAEGGLRIDANQQVHVRRGRLEVEIAGSSAEFAGGTTKYQVRVKNAGDATAADVRADVTLPQGARRIASGDSSGNSNSDLALRIGSLSPGAERVFTFVCQLTVPGANRVEATATGSDNLNAVESFVTQVKALADLKLLVNDPQGPTAVGHDAFFEILIKNRGTKAAEQISVVVQFSDGIEPIAANGSTATIVPGQVLFQPIPRIDAGDEIVLKVTARASKEGTHRFRAQVNAADPETRLVAEESTYFFDTDNVSRTARKPE